jgi:hypothetical protein
LLDRHNRLNYIILSVPLMHVLGIHMSAMLTTMRCEALGEQWGALTGLWDASDRLSGLAKEGGNEDETLKMMLKKNDVPILLQDPLALMMHFILLLPVNIDKGRICRNRIEQ